MALRGQDQPPLGVLEAADVVDGALHVPRVALDVARRDRQGLHAVLGAVGELRQVVGPEAERRERPPAEPAAGRLVAGVRQGQERRRRQVERRVPAARRARPRRGQELLGGRHQVVRTTAHPLGLDRDQERVVGHERQHRDHPVHQDRGERLHSLDGDAVGDPLEHVDGAGKLLLQPERPRADLGGEEELAARRRPHAALGDLEAALVGDREPADLLDLVAPQLDAQRVVLGRREDVEDAAADRELAAPLDHVHARVRGVGQALGDVLEVDLVARVQLDRGELAEPLHDRLEEGADRDHQHPDRAGVARARRREPAARDCGAGVVGRVRIGGRRVREAAEHREAPGHRVRAGRQALVRQRLPAREDGDRVMVLVGEVGADRRRELVALATGRGHHDQRALGARRRQQRRAGTHGRHDVQLAPRARALDDGRSGRIGEDGGQESGEVHAVPWKVRPGRRRRSGQARAARSW